MSVPTLPATGITAADVHAYFDAIAERDREALIDAGALTIRRLELRDAVRAAVPGDLRALKVDTSEIRWKAVRQYMRLQHRAAGLVVNRGVLLVIAVGLAEANAELRGEPLMIRMRDVFEARALVLGIFGAAAAEVVTTKLHPEWTREKAPRA